MAQEVNYTMAYDDGTGNPGTVNVKMMVNDGDIQSVEGQLGTQHFDGSLHFTGLGGGPCIVCGPPPMMCRPVNPCPDDGGGGA